jgi:Dolichyl-phosphate-mannose-protein mannosyltransferase
MAMATPVEESLTRSAPRAEEDRPDRGRRAAVAVLVLLTIQFVSVSAWQAWRDSPTVDEPVHIATGLAALREREVRLNIEAPVFPKAVNALPLLVADIPLPLDGMWSEVTKLEPDELTGFEWAAFTNEFESMHLERDDYQRVVFLGRIMPIVQGALIGVVLFALGSALFGRSAGLLAGALWLTTPVAVGFSHLNSLDLAFTLAVLAACLALERHVRRPTTITLAWLAVACGLVMLVRYTGVLIVGAIAVGLLLAPRAGRSRWAAVADVAVIVVAAWAVVWVGTLAVAPGSGSIPYPTRTVGSGPLMRTASRVIDVIPWPKSYELGFQFQIAASPLESPAYLMGQSWRGVRWWFWPVTLAVKLPLAALAVAVLGPIAWFRLDRATIRRAATVLLPSVVVLVVFLLPFPKEVGIRYALPVVALLLVVGSPVAPWLVASRPRWVLAALLLVAQLASFWDAVPHSLAWTAPPFRPGYAVAAESSLDWGQDNRALVEWMDGRTVFVAPFGGSLEAVHKAPGYRQLLGTAPGDLRGLAAASVTELTTYQREQLSWLRAYCHVGTIGGSILLYRFEQPPTPEPGPSRPAGRCSGDVSVRTE